jgi:hypothetical protein
MQKKIEKNQKNILFCTRVQVENSFADELEK